MIAAGKLRAFFSRAREIGVAGVLRRVEYRMREPARARARAAWNAGYVGVAPPAALAPLAIGPFWIDPNDGLREAFRARHPGGCDRIVAQADAALAGDVSWVAPGARPDWHAALPGDGRWPCEPSDAIPIGSATPLGDVRLSWELGRFPHAVRLAQAAWITADARYARAAYVVLDDFVAHNPPGRGIAWAHAQEVAIRAVAWLWVLALTRGLGARDEAAERRWTWALLAHGDYVAAHLADHPSTHNHLVSEAAGLAVLGTVLGSLPPAERWRRLGLGVLWRELAKQVDGEGVHAEHSTHYHAFVLDSFVATLLLCERAGLSVPAAARERIGAMAEALAWWMRGDGTLPAIGDSDCGRAWRLGTDPLDRRDLLASAAVAFGRSDWGAIAGDAPGAFWITGGRAVPSEGAAPHPGGARHFEAAGLGVARTGFDENAEILLFRCGPTRFRPDVLRSHMHADALSVVWRAGSDDVLLDPGSYLYSESEGWRAVLRGTASHSCVVVDGRDQADVTSARFGISGERTARWLSWDGCADRLTAAAEHPAGAFPRVRRRLAWRAGRFVALCDDVLGAGTHAVEGWLQLPPGGLERDESGVVLRLPSGRFVRVQSFGAAIEVRSPKPGDPPGPGWSAPRYGLRTPGTALRIDAGMRSLPLRSLLLIQTSAAGRPTPGTATTDAAGAAAISVGGAVVRFTGDLGVRIEELA